MTLQNVRLPSIALAVNTPVKPAAPAAPPATPPAGPEAMSVGPQSMPGSPMGADVDPTTVSYYHVTVGDVFTMNKVRYQPGRIYQVAPGTFLGSLEDGSTFASHCMQINPQPKIEQ